MCYVVAIGFCNGHARIKNVIGGGGVRGLIVMMGEGGGAIPISNNFALEIDILFFRGGGVLRSSNVNRSRR